MQNFISSLEPAVSSRNAVHDADLGAADASQKKKNEPMPAVDWTWASAEAPTDEKVTCKTLLVAVGAVPSAYLRVLLSAGDDQKKQQGSSLAGYTLLASVLLPEVPLSFAAVQMELNANATLFYQSADKQTILCLAGQRIPTARAFAWTAEVFNHVSAESVVILDLFPEEKYQSAVDVMPLVRQVQSSQWTQPTTLPLLEQPNLIDNSPTASVLSYCEIFGIPAIVFVSLSSFHYAPAEIVRGYDSLSMGLFQELNVITGDSLDQPALNKLFHRQLSSPFNRLLTRMHVQQESVPAEFA